MPVQRLRSIWTRLPPGLRFVLAGVFALMTLLGVPTLGDGVAGWASWLGFVGSTAANYVFPTLGLLGLALFLSLQYAESRARKKSVRSQPAYRSVPEAESRAEDELLNSLRNKRAELDELWQQGRSLAMVLPPNEATLENEWRREYFTWREKTRQWIAEEISSVDAELWVSGSVDEAREGLRRHSPPSPWEIPFGRQLDDLLHIRDTKLDAN